LTITTRHRHAVEIELIDAVARVKIGEKLAEAKKIHHRKVGDGFGVWCEKRLGMTQQHANRLIDVAETLQLNPGVQLLNNKAILEYRRAPADVQEKVIEQITLDGKVFTAGSSAADPEWPQWSDRKIARRCAVDHKTVSALRSREVSGEVPQMECPRFVERGSDSLALLRFSRGNLRNGLFHLRGRESGHLSRGRDRDLAGLDHRDQFG
jgi:hypothetical protein